MGQGGSAERQSGRVWACWARGGVWAWPRELSRASREEGSPAANPVPEWAQRGGLLQLQGAAAREALPAHRGLRGVPSLHRHGRMRVSAAASAAAAARGSRSTRSAAAADGAAAAPCPLLFAAARAALARLFPGGRGRAARRLARRGCGASPPALLARGPSRIGGSSAGSGGGRIGRGCRLLAGRHLGRLCGCGLGGAKRCRGLGDRRQRFDRHLGHIWRQALHSHLGHHSHRMLACRQGGAHRVGAPPGPSPAPPPGSPGTLPLPVLPAVRPRGHPPSSPVGEYGSAVRSSGRSAHSSDSVPAAGQEGRAGHAWRSGGQHQDRMTCRWSSGGAHGRERHKGWAGAGGSDNKLAALRAGGPAAAASPVPRSCAASGSSPGTVSMLAAVLPHSQTTVKAPREAAWGPGTCGGVGVARADEDERQPAATALCSSRRRLPLLTRVGCVGPRLPPAPHPRRCLGRGAPAACGSRRPPTGRCARPAPLPS